MNYQQIILIQRLRNSIAKINPQIPDDAQEAALQKVLRIYSLDLLYNNEVFHNYIVNRNFKIKEIPYGEAFSSSDVSDSLEDTRNSIYNLKAAYERRVEILEILKGVEEQ